MREGRARIGCAASGVLLVLSAVAFVHLGAQLCGAEGVADATQVMLMPLLLIALLVEAAPPRGRLVGLFALGLVLSWLGDTLPRFLDGQAQFLAMLGCFLLAQTVYVIALWPLRRDALPAVDTRDAAPDGGADGLPEALRGRTLLRRAAVLPYVVAGLVIVVLCAPAAGALLPALVLYAAAICTMAVLATALGPRGMVGGALFVVSDALIALETFGVLTLPVHAFWVMLTYIAAQNLLVLGVLGRHASRVRDGARAGE
jgi:uncharacterized membrane protein YhhN